MIWLRTQVFVVVCLSAMVSCKSTKKKAAPTSSTPTVSAAKPNCGDGVLNGLEPCDGVAFIADATCASYGLGAGAVSCASDCTLDFGQCQMTDWCTANGKRGDGLCNACEVLGGAPDADCAVACGANGICADVYEPETGVASCANVDLVDPDCGGCGDGILQGAELCDGTTFGVASTCQDFGYVGGAIGCRDDCTPNFAGCQNHICGNGFLEADEDCDGAALRGQNCDSLGFLAGSVSCNSTCKISTQNCRQDNSAFLPVITALCGKLDSCAPVVGPLIANTTLCQQIFSCGIFDFFGSPGDVTACVSAINAVSCQDIFSETNSPSTVCASVFGGTSPFVASPGESCEGRYDCTDGYDCFQTPASSCDVCVADALLNESCSFASCASGLYCETGTQLCRAQKAFPASCQADNECISDLCDGNVCQDELALNEPCVSGQSLCQGNLECIDGTCQFRRTVGQACVGSSECVLGTACFAGYCTEIPIPADLCAPAALGAQCAFRCVPGAFCNDGICTALGGQGAPCSFSDECGANFFCDFTTDTCQPRLAIGSSCTSDSRCVPGALCLSLPSQPGGARCVYPAPNGTTCFGLDRYCQSVYCDDVSDICAEGNTCGL